MKPSRLLGAALLPARPCCRGRGPRRGLSRQAHHADRAFPAGSGTDAVGRIFGNELSSILGQQVIVENKPGANATIAANLVARARPDGYTIFVTTNTSHSAAPWLMKNVPYDPVKDFTPIARGGNLPFILVANPKRPGKRSPTWSPMRASAPGASPMPAATAPASWPAPRWPAAPISTSCTCPIKARRRA